MSMKKVQFTETILRDANQSLIATRMPFSVMEPILETLDKAGFYSVECWGGATFDSCMRFLDEDPWERLRNIKAKMPNTKLQMLLRGQNLLGYKHYPDDVVRKFVERSVANGIDVIRIFDALNDLRNLKVAVEETVKRGAIASGAISYTTSPVHTLKKYVEICREMKEMGFETICIKDMAGVMAPQECYDLVSAIKDSLDIPVVIHTHCTTGLAYMTLLKGVEAGADVIDTALSSFSGGTSQAATETLSYALKQLGYEVELDDAVLKICNDHFKAYQGECLKSGLLKPVSMRTDTDALNYKVPGGMLSNLVSQLDQAGALTGGRGAGRDPCGPGGPGLPPAGHPYVPDGGRAGGLQRAHGQIQEHRQRGPGLHPWRVRPGPRRDRPRPDEAGPGGREAHGRPLRRHPGAPL